MGREGTDWVHDTLVERSRRRQEREDAARTVGSGATAMFWRLIEACESWFIVSLVGQ